jgi:hypothetical protein
MQHSKRNQVRKPNVFLHLSADRQVRALNLPSGVVPPATPGGSFRAWGSESCVNPAPRPTQGGEAWRS